MRQFIYKSMPCATPQSTDCVLFVGDSLKTTEVDETCLPTVTTIIENLDKTVDELTKSLDITKLKTSLSINVEKATVSEFLQALSSSITSIKAEISQLKLHQNIDILAAPIQLDLSCLGSSCDNASATTLLTVIKLLSDEICSLKSQVNLPSTYFQPI